MTSRYEPRRLATRADDEPEIAAAIVALRDERADAARLRALAERLAPELATPTVAGSAIPALAGWMKISSGLIVSLAIGVHLATSGRPLPKGTQVEPRTPPQPATSANPPPAAPAITAPTPTQRAADIPAAQPLAARRTHPRRETAGATAVPPSPEAELVLLERSRASLDVDAALALELAEQHAKSYPQGVFAQEREMLAIEALLKLDRKPAARARAERFLSRYPDSPQAHRVRAWINRTPDSAAARPND